MTHLPPKAPPMAQKWPSFNYQATTTPMSTTQPSSWMDDFVDFSSARRNRRSDEAIQFVETPFTSECRDSNGFERLDDEQLSSMFTDEFTGNAPSLKASSTASDQNSDDDEPKATKQKLKSEPGEVEDHSGGYEHDSESGNARVNFSSDGGTIIDPKRVKRILANRQSAQRSRIRKLHYISELERSVTSLQTEVSTLSPRVAYLDHQRLILNVDNSSLKQRIAALAQDKIFKDAHQEALRKEIERLRRVYQEQNMNNNKKDNNTTAMTSQPPAATVNCTDE